ncbi:MAG: hypothetical protein AAFV45_04215 [Pseudomonadota bacterium]
MVDAAVRLGITDFRDGMYWDRVERKQGVYAFDDPTTLYPALLRESGVGLSITVNWGNALYDDGATPHSAEAITAHGRYVAALIERFPAIHTIEVGNEFNSGNFVNGPVGQTDIDGRAAAHVAILRSVYEAAKSAGRPVKVLGGAAHSIPAGYLWAVLDKGGADVMDALVIHPYTTPPEHLARQIAVLRRHPKARDMPIEVTEFGSRNTHTADAYLIKMVAVMAASGVERAAWYALNSRGDGFVPLLDLKGEPTAVGRAYLFAQKMLAGRTAKDISPDPFTYAIRFADNTLVLWGEPRGVKLGNNVMAYDVRGEVVSRDGLTLSYDAPVLLVSAQPIELGNTVRLEPHPVLADSAYDFAYPDPAAAGPKRKPEGLLERFIRINRADELAFQTMPGQERPGTLWTPYLGRDGLYPLRLAATNLVTTKDRNTPRIVQRYRTALTRPVDLTVELDPAARSADGVTATVWHNDTIILAKTINHSFRFTRRLDMTRGDTVELEVGAGPTRNGDVVSYHFRLTTVEP